MNLFQSVMKKDLARVTSGKVTNAEAMAILEKTKFPDYMAVELQRLQNEGIVTDNMSVKEKRDMIGRSFKTKQEAGELQWPLYDWFMDFFGPVTNCE